MVDVLRRLALAEPVPAALGRLDLAVADDRGEKHQPVGDDRRAPAETRQRRAPGDVVGRAPAFRQAGVVGDDTGRVRSPELAPLLRADGCSPDQRERNDEQPRSRSNGVTPARTASFGHVTGLRHASICSRSTAFVAPLRYKKHMLPPLSTSFSVARTPRPAPVSPPISPDALDVPRRTPCRRAPSLPLSGPPLHPNHVRESVLCWSRRPYAVPPRSLGAGQPIQRPPRRVRAIDPVATAKRQPRPSPESPTTPFAFQPRP